MRRLFTWLLVLGISSIVISVAVAECAPAAPMPCCPSSSTGCPGTCVSPAGTNPALIQHPTGVPREPTSGYANRPEPTADLHMVPRMPLTTGGDLFKRIHVFLI